MRSVLLIIASVALVGCGMGADENGADRSELAERLCKQEVASRFEDPESVSWKNIVTRPVTEGEAWELQGEASSTGRFVPWTCLAVYDPDAGAMRADTVRLTVD